MKIGIFTHTYLPRVGGKELATHNLARELASIGHDVRVFVARSERDSPKSEIIDGVVVHRLLPEYMFVGRHWRFCEWSQYALRLVWQCSSILREWRHYRMDIAHGDLRPDLVLCVMLFAALTRTPFVVTAYGSDLMLLHTRPRPHHWIVRSALARARRVITVSQKLREVAVSLVPGVNDRLHVIHVGVDLKFFEECSSLPRLVDEPYIVAIGRMHHVKGRDVLLAAFPQILARYPECRVVLTGDGGNRQELHRLARELDISDHTVFWGNASRREVAQLLHGCELSVLPSRSEGLPLSVIESFACSKPIVATRVGGIPEIVEDGHSGILVAPEDPDGLAEAILRLLENPKVRVWMGKNGYQIAKSHDWRSIARGYTSVFQNALTSVRESRKLVLT